MPHVETLLDGEKPAAGLAPALLQALEPLASDLDLSEVERAALEAARELGRFRQDVADAGREALAYMAEHAVPGVVLAGRPYHGDPAANHAVPALLRSYGFAVLTEDALPVPEAGEGSDGPRSRWEYPERILRAARFAAEREDLEFVMLYSFGCGLDAVTVDQARAVLKARGRSLTALKIDEMVDLAATRIRVRSMVAAREDRLRRGGAR